MWRIMEQDILWYINLPLHFWGTFGLLCASPWMHDQPLLPPIKTTCRSFLRWLVEKSRTISETLCCKMAAALDYNLLGNKQPPDGSNKSWYQTIVNIGNQTFTATERSLWIVGSINMIYVILQLIVAAQTGSLAMLSDAFHNLSDVGAAYVAFKCEHLRRKEAPDLPFGYLRMQVSSACDIFNFYLFSEFHTYNVCTLWYCRYWGRSLTLFVWLV